MIFFFFFKKHSRVFRLNERSSDESFNRIYKNIQRNIDLYIRNEDGFSVNAEFWVYWSLSFHINVIFP